MRSVRRLGDPDARPGRILLMTVDCPHCETSYLLPSHLLGEGGARVRCRACGRRFLVVPGDARSAQPTFAVAPPAPAEPGRALGATESPETAVEPRRLARELLADTTNRLGATLDEARAHGRLLAQFGPELVAVFDDYRRRLGGRGTTAEFLEALRDGWGLDLTPASGPT